MLKKFKENYAKNPMNKVVENALKNVPISTFCLNKDIINKTNNFFSIELPEARIYDQAKSERCWCYAGINLIQNNVVQNLHIEARTLELSINYLCFMDKLEKSNTLYNRILTNEKFDLKTELDNDYLQCGVCEGSYFEHFRALVSKYGLVPECVMPEVENSKDSYTLNGLFNDKVKKDISKLLELKKQKSNKNILEDKIAQMLEENFTLLAKCLGEPPYTFSYEYKDKDGKIVKLENITPIDFMNKYLTMDLANMVTIANMPMYNKQYGNLYRLHFDENVYENSAVDFLNEPIEDLKKLAIKQLKDGMPVYMGCNIFKMRNWESGVLDANLYNYQETFGIEPLTKKEALNFHAISHQHAMLFTGVHLEKEKIIRWKVEDSYGGSVHQNGYYIMNDNFFEEFVFCIVVDKKYLNKKQLEALKMNPILIDMDDPF